MRLTKDQVRVIYSQGFDAVYQLYELLQNQVDKLEERVSVLEQQHSKRSHNSSKPPSTDGFKREPRSLREKSGRKSGGQPGHPGTTLRQVDNPDYFESYQCNEICSCGRSLKHATIIDKEKRQVFDIPSIKIKVTEHQADIVRCHCGKIHTAQFPQQISAPVQYGEVINSHAVYLMTYQLLPMKRTQELFSDLFDVKISQGTLDNIGIEAYNRLEKTEQAIKEKIISSPVVHADETGYYVNGTREWLHSASTKSHTFYHCDSKRGLDAMEAGGILPYFKGRLIHDHWKSYFDYSCEHGLCNAHHLRELVFITEVFKEKWADKMRQHLLAIRDAVENSVVQKKTSLSNHDLSKYRSQYFLIVREGLKCQPEKYKKKPGQRGKVKQPPAKNLLDRFELYANEVLAFMYDFAVPFSNNLAERDVRMMKVQQKISGCFRSKMGAQIFCRIRGFVSTVKKNNLSISIYLKSIFTNNAYHSSLLPE